MWNKGSLNINGMECTYWVKHYEEPSEEYGIDGGRMSKLEIRVNGKTTCSYERGWETEPEDETSQLAFAAMMQKFN